MIKVIACISQQHDWRLILLAAAVCSFLCALTMAVSAPRLAGRHGRGLVPSAILPAFTASAAIWATHFIAMLAFDPGLPTGFEPVLTAGSFLIAMAFALGCFHLALAKRRPALGGLLLGAGVALMHYTGMAAFRTQGVLSWDLGYVAVSLMLGLPLASLSMACLKRRGWRWRALSAFLMILAICSLHFTAMAAATITPDPRVVVQGSFLSHVVIAAIAAFAIVAFTVITVWLSLTARSRQATFEHLREAISAMSDGIAIFDVDQELVAWNDRFGELTGADTVLGAPQTAIAAQLLDRLVEGEAGDEPLTVLLCHGEPADAGYEREAADGRWLRIRNQKAAHGGAVWIIADITLEHAARRDAHARAQLLEQEKRTAEAASQAKSSFLAMVSHELRTPMNGVLGMAHALKMTSLDTRQEDYVHTLIRSGDGLLAILDDVLDLAKIEAGKFDIETAPFDLPDLLIGVHDLWSAKAKSRRLSFDLSLAPDLPQWVEGDAGRVRQVVLNLVSNALKFTEAGGVAVSAQRGQGDSIVIAVVDTGPGIEPAAQAQLFQDFAQAGPAIARRFGGTGLGLSISRKLARLMGGDLTLVSQPGTGSTFRVEVQLPAADAPQMASVQDPGAQPSAPRRVLAVDDNPTNLLVARALLESLGCEVVTADNGPQALALAAADIFDLVFMDIQMPGMDGYEALSRLRQLEGAHGQVPVVALTANAMAGEREKYLAAGFDDYMSKPIRPDALVQVLARAQVVDTTPVRVAG